MSHIAISRGADAILVAPASADFIRKLAHGAADDLLSGPATPKPRMRRCTASLQPRRCGRIRPDLVYKGLAKWNP